MTQIHLLLSLLFISVYLNAQEQIKIKVNTNEKLGRVEPFWASQIVHPTEYLLTEWGRNFVQLASENGAARQFIRIYNQPEHAIRISKDGKITYDWSRFDEMADLILSTGNKLKVVFFGMPLELAAHPESVLKRSSGIEVCNSPPKDYKQWEQLCEDFTKHVISRYGIREVKKWTFRCWNEPDHHSFWYKGDLAEYLKLYDHFANGIKNVDSSIRIGGPALTSTGTYIKPENFTFFLQHITNGVNFATGRVGSPIDFIAVHTYGGAGAGGGPGRQYPDVEYLLQQQLAYADMRDKYPKLHNVPIHVEEWGVTSSGTTGIEKKPSADVRNSQYGAAFLTTWVAKHIELKRENDRLIESFTFCGSGYDGMRTKDFMGFRTLDTKSGFHKPILNAYKLLDKLAHELASTTIHNPSKEISTFATHDEKRITIVVSNYQYDKVSSDGPAFTVAINIDTSWKPSASVTIKHWRIDQDHSNAYTVFKKLGSPQYPNPIEVDRVKSRMGLEVLDSPKTMKAAQLTNIQFELPCNAVSLIEIVAN